MSLIMNFHSRKSATSVSTVLGHKASWSALQSILQNILEISIANVIYTISWIKRCSKEEHVL